MEDMTLKAFYKKNDRRMRSNAQLENLYKHLACIYVQEQYVPRFSCSHIVKNMTN